MDHGGAPGALYRATVHGEGSAPSDALMAFRPVDPTNRPAPLKRYDIASLPLPRELARSSLSAMEVLSGGRGAPSVLDDAVLGTLLFLAGGVTRVAYAPDGEPIWFRTSMSAGNLHPVEIYVVRDGVWHYQPLEHALVPLRRPRQSDPPNAPNPPSAATLVLTGIPFRTCWKYGERGWRHLWWDAGSLLANLLAAADAQGVPAAVSVAFADEAVAGLVGIDGVDEVPLALVQLGSGADALPAVEALSELQAAAAPVAQRVLRFPLVVDAQAQSSLRVQEVDAWRAAAGEAARPAPQNVALPSGHDRADRIEDVVSRRGSTRVFRTDPVAGELLSWTLAAATRAAPLDVTRAGTLLEHFVNVHAVRGLDPGGYRYRGDRQYEGRVRSDDARAYGARLCLDQRLGGESAYTVFHTADTEALVARLGGRSYRATLLEAGLVAGRLALGAVALGGGATGLTFYDGLVQRYFRTEATPLLATAVGRPATDPAPSGQPGSPVELRGYPRVAAGDRQPPGPVR